MYGYEINVDFDTRLKREHLPDYYYNNVLC